MQQITDALQAARIAIHDGDTQRALGQLHLAKTYAHAYTDGTKPMHRVMRGYIAQADTALRDLEGKR